MPTGRLQGKLEHNGIRNLITQQINEFKLLVSFNDETVGHATEILLSQGVTSWITQAGRTHAVLEADQAKIQAQAAKNKLSALSKPKGPQPTVAKRKHKPKKPLNSANTQAKVNLPIHIIGKIHIPKPMYNFLRLGANYTVGWAQQTQAQSCTGRKEGVAALNQVAVTNLNKQQQEFLQTHNITLDLYLEIVMLFEFLAITFELPEEYLWSKFWHPDIKAAELNLDIFSFLKHPKNANPMSRLTNLLKSRQIIGKMADKNPGLTLMPHEWYHNKLMGHILEANAYRKISNNPQLKILTELKWICKTFDKNPEYWFDKEKTVIVIPEMYMMPKIHKTAIGVRPIIPSHTWYTTKAAKYIHNILLPVVKRIPWVVQDRLTLIQELENKGFYSITYAYPPWTSEPCTPLLT